MHAATLLEHLYIYLILVQHLHEVQLSTCCDFTLQDKGRGNEFCWVVIFVMGGDDLDSPRSLSSITCSLSSPPATKSVTRRTEEQALGRDTRDNTGINCSSVYCVMGVWMEVNGFRDILSFLKTWICLLMCILQSR